MAMGSRLRAVVGSGRLTETKLEARSTLTEDSVGAGIPACL